MSDNDSDCRPPFNNFCRDTTLQQTLSSFSNYATIYHERLLHEVVQLGNFKRYTQKELAAFVKVRSEMTKLEKALGELQTFRGSVTAHFQSIEDKISDLKQAGSISNDTETKKEHAIDGADHHIANREDNSPGPGDQVVACKVLDSDEGVVD